MKLIIRNIFIILISLVSIYVFCLIQNIKPNTSAFLIATILSFLSYTSIPKISETKNNFLAQILISILIAISFYWLFDSYS